GERSMLDKTETKFDTSRDIIAASVAAWLKQFERALAQADRAALARLFRRDSYWRDVLALTWRIQTFNGVDTFLNELQASAERLHPANFTIDTRRAPPRRVTRAGTESIEAMVAFETAQGRGSGVVRLIPDGDDGDLKAWTLLTALDEIKGHE